MAQDRSANERLFDFPEVGPLNAIDARRAIELPALAEDILIEEPALDRIVRETHGYPYFLQEWGKHAWEAADSSPIGVDDVERGSVLALAALDEGFFRVRFDRLTPAEKRYLRAMAELGAGPHRSGDIAAVQRTQSPSLGPTRSNLISKGMVWSPIHTPRSRFRCSTGSWCEPCRTATGAPPEIPLSYAPRCN